jgi:hypothetical protein
MEWNMRRATKAHQRLSPKAKEVKHHLAFPTWGEEKVKYSLKYN